MSTHPSHDDEGLRIRVSPDSSQLQISIAHAAAIGRIPPADFRPLALLHLPRLADSSGHVSVGEAQQEIERLRQAAATAGRMHQPASDLIATYRVEPIEEDVARQLCERNHYLRSHRTRSRYYGLIGEEGADRPWAICVTSPFDMPGVRLMVPPEIPTDLVRNVSRIYAHAGTPSNALSFVLSRVLRAEKRDGVALVTTYVNPNLGFTGVSYRASGWQLIGQDPLVNYKYIDGDFVTDRSLYETGQGGTSIARLLGGRYAESTMRLRPLFVFVRPLTAAASRALAGSKKYLF